MCCLDYWVCVTTWTRIASQSFLVAIICLPSNYAPTRTILRRGGKSDSPVSLFSLSVSVSISLFCSQLASIRCLNAVQRGLSSNRNADDTGPAAVLPPSPSPGLLLYTEGNKDTRRISVVCLTKWLPESEKAMPMGSTTTLFSSTLLCRGPPRPPAWASLRSALSQGALWMCDRLWVGEFMLMLKRQRTQTDNPWLKQCCSNFPP